MIYIAVCDDDKKMAYLLKEKVSLILQKNNVLADISVYAQSSTLQYDIEEGKYFDLVLSDIEMPNIDGMQLVENIRKYISDVVVIFITSHVKYAVDSYELSIFRYVPKNVIDIKLIHAVQDALKLIIGRSKETYCINMPSRVEKILCRNILYIEREGKNSVLTLKNGSATRVRKSLSNVMKELNSEDFIYIDRGIIANVQHIVKIIDGIVELEDGIRLPASHTKIEQLKKKIDKFWSERI